MKYFITRTFASSTILNEFLKYSKIATWIVLENLFIFFIQLNCYSDTRTPDISLTSYGQLVNEIHKFNSNHAACACESDPKDKRNCVALNGYPRKTPALLSCFEGTAPDLCGSWSYSSASSLDLCQPPKIKTNDVNRYSSKHREESVETMKKRGWSVVTDKETDKERETKREKTIQEYVKGFQKIKIGVRRNCCGDDLRCLKTFDSVNFKFCKPGGRTSCADGAYFSSKDENGVLFSAARSRLLEFRDVVNDKNIRSKIEANLHYIVPYDYLKDYVRKNILHRSAEILEDLPIAGEIVASPYFSEGNFQSDQFILEHELDHACSDIKRQEAMLWTKDPNLFISTYLTFYPATKQDACDSSLVEPSYKELFQNEVVSTFDNKDQQNKNFMDCVFEVARNARTGTKNRFKCEYGCPTEYLEESFAELALPLV
jgi:hypothetical protein